MGSTAREATVERRKRRTETPYERRASTRVGGVLAGKPTGGAVTIGPEESVFEGLRRMAAHNIGALVVVEEGRVVGVMSERDYARKVILIGKSSRETRVREIMTSPAVTVGPDDTIASCMELMTARFIRHLPVVDAGSLVGCISIGDVVKRLLAEQQERIGQYEAYISGAYPT